MCDLVAGIHTLQSLFFIGYRRNADIVNTIIYAIYDLMWRWRDPKHRIAARVE